MALVMCAVLAGAIGIVAYNTFLSSTGSHVKGGGLENPHVQMAGQTQEQLTTARSPKPDDSGDVANNDGGRTAASDTADASRLLRTVEDRASGVTERAAAADQLGKLREEAAFESFLRIVQDASEPIMLKYKVARGLGVLGDERAVPVLSAILTNQSADNHLRIISALALGNLGSETSVAALQRAGDDPDYMIRFKVVEGLGRTRQKSALGFVERATADPDPHVQARAIHSLGELGDKSTVGTIRTILQTTQSDFIKIACLTALGSIQELESVSLLHEYEYETNQLIRLNAQAALQRLRQSQKGRSQ